MVDTDETATKVMDILNRERSGRVTFMPLNRLKNKSFDYPEGDEAIPLITKLQYNPEYEQAIRQVSGDLTRP